MEGARAVATQDGGGGSMSGGDRGHLGRLSDLVCSPITPPDPTAVVRAATVHDSIRVSDMV
jgi:hypothetical protein